MRRGSLPFIGTHAAPLTKDLWRFVLHPTPAETRLEWGRDYRIALILLLVMDLTLNYATDGIIWAAEKAGYEPPDTLKVDLSSPLGWVTLIALAPLFEELVFRGFLSGRRAALMFGARAVVGTIIMLSATELLANGVSWHLSLGIWLFGLTVVAASAILWLRTHQTQTNVPLWFTRHFRWLVWGSSLLFGLIHLANFVGPIAPYDGILVVSQTAGGLILAYTRTRLGLWAAIAQHASFNAILWVVFAAFE